MVLAFRRCLDGMYGGRNPTFTGYRTTRVPIRSPVHQGELAVFLYIRSPHKKGAPTLLGHILKAGVFRIRWGQI
jgi:hypothetical protein